MKHIYTITGLLAACIFASCRGKNCESAGISGLSIERSDGLAINDTFVYLIRTAPDGNSDTMSFSFPEPGRNSLIMEFPGGKTDGYNNAYSCLLYPSGKQYSINGIKAGSEKGKPGFSCVNPVYYLVNGVSKKQTGYFTMKGYLLSVDY